jgi:hypothetical protein
LIQHKKDSSSSSSSTSSLSSTKTLTSSNPVLDIKSEFMYPPHHPLHSHQHINGRSNSIGTFSPLSLSTNSLLNFNQPYLYQYPDQQQQYYNQTSRNGNSQK